MRRCGVHNEPLPLSLSRVCSYEKPQDFFPGDANRINGTRRQPTYSRSLIAAGDDRARAPTNAGGTGAAAARVVVVVPLRVVVVV